MSDFDMNELMATFTDETAEHIAALEAGLLALEASPGDVETKHELLRLAHTIKGNASCVGLAEVTAFGVVVRIEHVFIQPPLASFQPSHSPATANNSPSFTSKQNGCFEVPLRFHS